MVEDVRKYFANGGGGIAAARKGDLLTPDSPPEKLVDDPRIRAMLDVIVYAEGTGAGYGTIVRGRVINSPFNPDLIGKTNVVITDFSKHPQIDVVWKEGAKTSSAAGRYQILYSTWKDLGGDARDFSPRSQDIMAVRLMIRRGMIKPLLEEEVETAIHAGAGEWASFPNSNGTSNYNQPVKNITTLIGIYNGALASYQQ